MGDAIETIENDLPCSRCGYNLRTLGHEGVCPECGQSVQASRSAAFIRASELGTLRLLGADRLRASHRGLTLAVYAWFGGAASVPCIMGGSAPSDPIGGSLFLAFLLTPYVVSAWAAWHLAGARSDRRVAVSSRAALVVATASIGLLFLNGRWSTFYGSALPFLHSVPGGVFDTAQAVGRAATVAAPIANVLTLSAIIHLAWRARLKGVAVTCGLAGILVVGVPIVFAIGCLKHPPYTSSAVVGFLVGPTGSMPIVWAGPLLMLSEIPRGGLPVVGILTIMIGLTVGLSVSLVRLMRTLTRAIALGELPAASSRSSPAPRPPA